MEQLALTAEKRTIIGKQTKELRKAGILPAVVYGSGEKSINIQIDAKAFAKILKIASHSTLVNITLDGLNFKVLIDEVQMNPRLRSISHVMLNKVNLKEEITADVAILLSGEAPAEKIEKAVLITLVSTLEVRCLPTVLPQNILVDVSTLIKIGDSISVEQITLPEGVKLVHEDDREKVLVSASAPQKEEVEEANASVAPEEIQISVKKGKEDIK